MMHFLGIFRKDKTNRELDKLRLNLRAIGEDISLNMDKRQVLFILE
jgi:hypothetical protein